MFPKEALAQELTERVATMGLSVHDMVGLIFDVAARCGLSCNEVRRGTTLLKRE